MNDPLPNIPTVHPVRCVECGRVLDGVVELVDHYLLKHREQKVAA